MDVDAAGSEVAGCGEFHGGLSAFHSDDGLDYPFPKLRSPKMVARLIVLKSSSDDFAGGC
jgi:hypothetical protein